MDEWLVLRWYIGDVKVAFLRVWVVFEWGCLEDVWVGDWVMCGRCLAGVWLMHGWCCFGCGVRGMFV